jgi:hypothetical protein
MDENNAVKRRLEVNHEVNFGANCQRRVDFGWMGYKGAQVGREEDFMYSTHCPVRGIVCNDVVIIIDIQYRACTKVAP